MRKLLLLTMGFSLLSLLGMTSLNAQVALPYSIDFGESQEGWTVIDNSSIAGTSWTFKEKGAYNQGVYYPCVVINMDYQADCDDYYISPAFNLKAGTEYTISTVTCGTTFERDGIAVSLAIGTSVGDLTTFTKISGLNVPVSFQNTESEKTKLTVETDGIYYIAFHATTLKFNGETCLFNFSLSENGTGEPDPEQPVTLPYEVDLRKSVEGWTTADNNGDGTTWTYYSDYGVAMDMALSSPHDDDYISPAFELEKGKRYKINTIVTVNGQPSSSDRIAIMGGKVGNILEEIGPLNLTTFGENKEELYFVPSENGLYCFAFRNTSDPFANTLLLYHFGMVETDNPSGPEVTIFSTDFSGEEPIKDWTILDANADKVTWNILNGLGGVTYDGNNATGGADDWLVTPTLSLKEGQDYLIKYKLLQAGAFEEDNIEIKWGTTPTVTGLSELVATEVINLESGEVSKTCRFTSSVTGNAYIGFHITTPDMNGTLSLTGMEIIAVEKAIPLPVEDLQANSDFKAKSVTLKWVNPTYDTKQSPIISPLNIRIYENENLLETLSEGIIAGEPKEYTYTPIIPFTGEVNYKVAAVIGDSESEPVSATICLDDVQGDTILVQNLSLENEEAFNQWVIEDKNGGKTWTYTAWNKGASIPRMSIDNNDWLISPAVSLSPDKRYVLQYELSTSSGFGGSLDVTVGDTQSVDGQTTILASYVDLKENGAEYVTRQFSVAATGNYYIGFHAGKVENGMTLRNIRISYIGEEGEKVPVMELPYNQNFDEAVEMPEGWKATGNTGAYGFNVIDVADYLGQPDIQAHTSPNAVYAMGGAFMPRSELLYTPKFELKQGMEYAVEFWLLMPEMSGKKNILNVYAASEQDEGSVIGSSLHEVRDGVPAWSKQHFIFKPEKDGEYCFIMKVTCSLTNAGYIMIDDFHIGKNVSLAVPAAPVNFRGSSSIMNTSIVMNWNNPAVDINGENLIPGTEVRTQLFENGHLLGEAVGEVGEFMNFVHKYSWEEFQGQKIIKAVSYIQDLKGGASTCIVNINSVADGLLEQTAFFADFDNAEGWTVIDKDNDGKKWNIDTTGKIASTEGNDDWLISPVIKLEKGKTYYVSCELQTNTDEGSNIKFTMGNSQNIENQTTEITLYEKLTLGNFGLLEIGKPFIAEHAENFFGVHVTDNTGEVIIKNIRITRLFEGSEPEEIPYAENFDDMNNMDDQTQFTNKWGRRTGSANLFRISKMPESTILAHSGEYVVLAEESPLKGRYELLYTPMFNFERGKDYEVTYFLYMPGNEGRKTVASVSVSPTQESPYIGLEVLQEIENPVTEWLKFSFIYTAKDDQPSCFYFYFEATEANAGMIAFDDFSIEETIPDRINKTEKQARMYFNRLTSTLVLPSDIWYLTIYDVQGRLVFSRKVENDRIDLSMLQKGFYYVQVRNKEGQLINQKIMK